MSMTWKVMTVLSGNAPTALGNRRLEAAGQPRRLLRRPIPLAPQLHSPRRINKLLAGLPGAADYLEIGVFTGHTLENVKATRRVGVDPDPRFDVGDLPRGLTFNVATSDAFFDGLEPTARFDVAFIDGLHTYEQTYRDLINTLGRLDDGLILIDDTVPDDEYSAIRDEAESRAQREAAGLMDRRWHGDVWKVVAAIKDHHPELSYRTITSVGNPQTLVWRADLSASISTPSPEDLEAIGALSYAEVLAPGLPDWFNPASEDEAINTALGVVAQRRA
jgi:hypothetical protein